MMGIVKLWMWFLLNKGFIWLFEIFFGFVLIFLFSVLFFNYSETNLEYVFALQKANDVLRVNSYTHADLDLSLLNSFFDNFGYVYCVNSECISNNIVKENKLVREEEIIYSDLDEKKVSIIVFYD